AENARLKKEMEQLMSLYDDKNAQVRRYIRTVAQLENKIESLKEDNLRLEGKLNHQTAVMTFLYRQNADLLLESRAKMPKVTTLTVKEVKTGA
ncbi:MAG: hypothetical protein IJX24_06855, partial [Oscillospiraceae bacterium]|nr:hypothetical protein [Oscillospiraceae bacterium]